MPPRPLAALRRRRREGDAPAPAPPQPKVPRRRAPAPNELRRERRELLKLREERIRDLGGLVLEMFRRDSFREHLLYEQCAEVGALEERLQELDALLDARRPPAARCACGAPLFWGSRFCANCGRPAVAPPPSACANCGHALAAGASFCPACGVPADASEPAAADPAHGTVAEDGVR